MKTEIEIRRECEKFDITNYIINVDGSIDVDGFVNISNTDLKSLPIKFNKVSEYFYCNNNKLTTLEGCPKEVGGSFCCNDNDLTSLKYSPTYVGDNFSCALNKITSLEYCPTEMNDFNCASNKLTSLEYCPQDVWGYFNCNSNEINTIKYFPNNIDGNFHCRKNRILLEDIVFSEFAENFDLTQSFGFSENEIRITKIYIITS